MCARKSFFLKFCRNRPLNFQLIFGMIAYLSAHFPGCECLFSRGCVKLEITLQLSQYCTASGVRNLDSFIHSYKQRIATHKVGYLKRLPDLSLLFRDWWWCLFLGIDKLTCSLYLDVGLSDILSVYF